MAGPATYREVFRGGLGRLAAGLMLLEFSAAIQVFITATVLPLVSAELDGGRYYGLALSAGTVAIFVATPVTAPLMLRLGPRSVLGAAAVLHLTGTVVSAASAAMPIFALGRLIQGFGTGLLMALGYALLAERFPARMRPRLIALLTSMWLLPSLLGPGGAALLATVFGWRITLAASAPPVLAAVLLVIGQVRGDPDEPSRPRPVPAVAVAVLAGGGGMISFGGTTTGVPAAGLLVGGLILVIVGAVRVLPAGTIAGRPPQSAAVAALVLSTFAFLGGDGLTTLYVTQGLGRPIGWAAAVLSTAGIAWSVGTLLHARLLQRLSGRTAPMVLTGGILVVVGMSLLILVLLGAGAVSGRRPAGLPAVGLVVLAWTVAGAGMGLLYPTLSVAALQVPAADAAAMSSAVVLAEAIGGTISLAAGGSLVSLSATLTGHFTAGLIGAYTLFAGAALAIGYYGRRSPEQLQA
jgi:MFS family permease